MTIRPNPKQVSHLVSPLVLAMLRMITEAAGVMMNNTQQEDMMGEAIRTMNVSAMSEDILHACDNRTLDEADENPDQCEV